MLLAENQLLELMTKVGHLKTVTHDKGWSPKTITQLDLRSVQARTRPTSARVIAGNKICIGCPSAAVSDNACKPIPSQADMCQDILNLLIFCHKPTSAHCRRLAKSPRQQGLHVAILQHGQPAKSSSARQDSIVLQMAPVAARSGLPQLL